MNDTGSRISDKKSFVNIGSLKETKLSYIKTGSYLNLQCMFVPGKITSLEALTCLKVTGSCELTHNYSPVSLGIRI